MNPVQEFWNERYQQAGFAYGDLPNVFFKEHLPLLPAGRLLLPAEGEGRNAVYAARQGWEVTAFDFSAEARRKALHLAQDHKATIRYELQDIATYEPKVQTYDCIALLYVHQPSALRKALHRKLLQALKPTGCILLEAFSKHQARYTSGGPQDAAMLLSPRELEADFRPLHFSLLEEKEIDLQEGIYHQGKAHVVRMVATPPKPL